MAGSLILLDSITASDDASLTLGTTDWDSSYDVYMVKIFNLTPATNDHGKAFSYFAIKLLET